MNPPVKNKDKHTGIYTDPHKIIEALVSEKIHQINKHNYCNIIITALAYKFYADSLYLTLGADNKGMGAMEEIALRKDAPTVAPQFVERAIQYYTKHILPLKEIKKISVWCHIGRFLCARFLAMADTFLAFLFVTLFAKDSLDKVISFLKYLRDVL